MAKITFEHSKDLRGNDVLLAIKKRGKISITELQEAMQVSRYYAGSGWAVLFKVFEDSGYSGWFDEEQGKGDILELYRIDDFENCPVCADTLVVNYCPHCGERIKEASTNGKV